MHNPFRLKYIAAALIMTGLSMPVPARADIHQAVGAVLLICILNPKACEGNNGRRAGGGGGGSVHAVALNKQQKMYVQQGLQDLGVYHGAIDGAFGRQSAASIKQYQQAIGHAPANGRMTKRQVTDIMAYAPRYKGLPSDSPLLFEIEFQRDVTRPELQQIQQQLNVLGYNAGTPDGVFGRRTANAIASYKRNYGLGGPAEATRRLHALLTGNPAPPFEMLAIVAPAFVPGYRPTVLAGAPDVVPGARGIAGGGAAAGHEEVAMRAEPEAEKDDQGLVSLADLGKPAEPEEEVLPAPAVVVEVSDLDILSMRTGITEAEALAVAKEEIENGYFQETATAEKMGGDKIHSYGLHIVEAGFPAPFTNRMTLIYDEAFPDLGALAIFRQVALPDGLTLEQIERDIVPKAIASFGADARFATKLVWVSDGEARAEIGLDEVLLNECGAYRLDYSQRGADGGETWEAGGGPQLVAEAMNSVQRACGDVLTINYSENSLEFSLWNTDMILDQMAVMGVPAADAKAGIAGKIKF